VISDGGHHRLYGFDIERGGFARPRQRLATVAAIVYSEHVEHRRHLRAGRNNIADAASAAESFHSVTCL
jgi:hypothetical protein